MVLAVLHQTEGLVTAEAIHQQVRHISSAVDISTVYRTLDLLTELQMISMLDLGDGQRRYEFVGRSALHHHLLCNRCGGLTRVDASQLQLLSDHIQREFNFEVDLGSMTFRGLCGNCAANPPGGHSAHTE
jgi:Fur family ferric uptake transcriptional regulator